jgi:hypothetical protein
LGGPVDLFTSPVAFTNSIIVRGSQTTADSVTVDFSGGGFFSLPGGIEVKGGAGSGDLLTVAGLSGSANLCVAGAIARQWHAQA